VVPGERAVSVTGKGDEGAGPGQGFFSVFLFRWQRNLMATERSWKNKQVCPAAKGP